MVRLSRGKGMDDAGSGHQASLFQRLPFLISTLTSKMPVRCTEHQDLVGEKDEQGKALSANVERSAGKLP